MAILVNIDDDTKKKDWIEKFSKIIQSAHLNFLIGSGCSQPAISPLQNLEKDYEKLVEDSKFEEADRLLFSFLRPFILTPHEWGDTSQTNFKAALDNYQHFLQNITRILVKRKNPLISKRANIFTTNYDLLIEGAYETIGEQFNLVDGFKRGPGLSSAFRFSPSEFFTTHFNDGNLYGYKVEIPTVNLVKLHGSLNWISNNNVIVFSLDHLGVFKDEHQRLSINGNATELAKFNDGFSIVLPRREKFRDTVLYPTYYALLRNFLNELNRENTLLVVDGFSFADEHILNLTKQALQNPTLQLTLFSFSNDDKNKFETMFAPFNNVDVVYSDSSEVCFTRFNEIIMGLL
jgi:hypothetical protein